MFDPFDRRVLDELRRDGSLGVAEPARRVGLSASPRRRRVRRLEEAGVLRGGAVRPDREKLGLGFVAYAYVKRAVERAVLRRPEAVAREMMTGAADVLVKVVTTDVRAYDAFLRDRLFAQSEVADVRSRIVVSTVKEEGRPPPPGRG